MGTLLLQRLFALMGCAIYFTVITVSLASRQATNACDRVPFVTTDGKCKPPAKVVANCSVKKMTLTYSANLAPSNVLHSKVSKRFQFCQSSIWESEMPNTQCSLKQGDCLSERTIEFPNRHSKRIKEEFKKEMKNGAHFADYLDIWILGIDFRPHTALCIKLGADEKNCQFNCTIPDEIILEANTSSTTSTTAETSTILTTTELDYSMFLVECNGTIFGLPMSKLQGFPEKQWNNEDKSRFEWHKDFDHLAECTLYMKTNYKKEDYLAHWHLYERTDGFEHWSQLDVGIEKGENGSYTEFLLKYYSPGQLEALKFMVKHTSDCGQLLFSMDDAFGPPKSYGIDTRYFETFELMLKNAGLPPPAAPRDEVKNWNYTRIEYQLEQEYFICPKFHIKSPSVSGKMEFQYIDVDNYFRNAIIGCETLSNPIYTINTYDIEQSCTNQTVHFDVAEHPNVKDLSNFGITKLMEECIEFYKKEQFYDY